jgi:hypothetical protein
MRSNIDTPVKLDEHGVAEVCGPLGWDPGEQRARVTVTITQNQVVGTASGSFERPESEDEDEDEDENEWMLTVQPSDPHKFHKGDARGEGSIEATGGSGKRLTWPPHDIKLDPNAPDDT